VLRRRLNVGIGPSDAALKVRVEKPRRDLPRWPRLEKEKGECGGVGSDYLDPIGEFEAGWSDGARKVGSEGRRQRDHCRHEVTRGVWAGGDSEVVPGVLIRGGNGLYRGRIGK